MLNEGEEEGKSQIPVPLSPPPPLISKELEVERAMSASHKSESSSLAISRAHFLYEDDWLIAVNKPSGVYCDHVLSSIPHLLLLPHSSNQTLKQVAGTDAKQQSAELHLVNRLDRDTSGLMIITKLHKAAAKFVKAYTEHKVKKTYIALSIGRSPAWDNITIKSGHGRSKFGAWRVYSASDVSRSLPGGSSVKEMVTTFQVLSVNNSMINSRTSSVHLDSKECVEEEEMLIVRDKGSMQVVSDDEEKDEILVRAYPTTGRTHQIRLHCQFLGIPLRGDVKYSGVHEWKGRKYSGHALHAESLSFEHPITGAVMELRAPLPSWATTDPCSFMEHEIGT